ncbi:DUF2680 domain-containing protein [Desulfitispora alkaliphila]|uniref:DUF2680 domain-containing protein n=1 Tax=Desulfitispora alkaliphila TaxID=622674 RepID=UPI003D1B4C70
MRKITNNKTTLHKDILSKKREMVNKYVEYGVISKEKGNKIISHMEKRYEKLEENDFIPKCPRSKKKCIEKTN